MKQMLKVLLLATLLQGSMMMDANAALISGGGGTFFTDTTTGLKWLNTQQTSPYSFNFVDSQLGAGGLFSGYRVATSAELLQLVTDASGQNIGYSTNGYAAHSLATLMTLIGCPTCGGSLVNGDRLYARMLDNLGASRIATLYTDISNSYGFDQAWDYNNAPLAFNPAAASGTGTFLVAIDEPETLPLIGMGIVAGIFGLRRRKNIAAVKLA